METPPPLKRGAATPATLLLVLSGVLCTGVLVTLPVLATAMAQQVGGGEAELGYLASADMLGSAIASLILAPLTPRVNARLLVRWALVLAIGANIAATNISTFEILFVVRVFAGLCAGAVLCVVFIGLCHTAAPDRSFGIYVFAQLLLQLALLPLFALVLDDYGPASLHLLLAAILALALLAAIFCANIFDLPRSESIGGGARFSLWSFGSVAALGVYFVAPAMIWAHLEGIGRSFGLDTAGIAASLGFASFAGAAGAAAAIAMTKTPRTGVLITIGFALSMVSLAPIFLGGGEWAFWALAGIFNFAWNFTFPYLMGVIALFDEAGETATQSLAAQLMGLAAGPLLAGFISAHGFGQAMLAAAALLILIATLAAFLWARQIGLAKAAAR